MTICRLSRLFLFTFIITLFLFYFNYYYSKNGDSEAIKQVTKKIPRFYKMLNYEKRESAKRLENIDELVKQNRDHLPNRTTSLTAHQICQKPMYCMPALKFFEGEIRVASKYKLSTCVVQKSMSTVMTSMFCYLRDERKFVENNRDILKDWKLIRFCKFRNEFRNLGSVAKKFNLTSSFTNWTNIMIVRHPIERFVSGFVDKCYRRPVISKFCNGCDLNLTCFMETELRRMSFQVANGSFYRTYEDRHFFPQNWRCNLHQYFNKFTFVRYTSDPTRPVTNQLFKIFRDHGVPESSITHINSSISSGRTAHSTVDTKASEFIEKRLISSPYLMELLVRMFYYDFVLFNYTLPF